MNSLDKLVEAKNHLVEAVELLALDISERGCATVTTAHVVVDAIVEMKNAVDALVRERILRTG